MARQFKQFKVQAVAALLGISVDQVRRDTDEAGIDVERQSGLGPKARLFSIENIYELAAFRARKHGIKSLRKVICTVYAPKGGIGKTTQTANLAAAATLMGYRVLVIDLDFQANLTIAHGYDPELTHEEAANEGKPLSACVEHHIGHLLPQWEGGRQVLSDVVKMPYGVHGPHLIPSDVSLDRLEALFTVDTLMQKRPELTIARFLAEGQAGKNKQMDLSGYDIVFFDAPPAKNQLTRSALLASDYVLAPVSMEKYSTKSVSYLASVLSEMHETYGKFPQLMILGNFYDKLRVRVAAQVIALTSKYPTAWLDKQVSTSEEFRKVLDDEDGLPLVVARPNSHAAGELREVTKAVLVKMGVL